MDDKVLNRVDEHSAAVDKYLKDKGYVRMVTYLQGSQNYGLDTENSDVDTLSLCIPTFENLCSGKSKISVTHLLPNGEHALIKDFRDVFNDGYKKQNINFVETLFTQYYNCAHGFENFYIMLNAVRDAIAHYSTYRTVAAVYGMIKTRIKKVYNEKGYVPKEACTILRQYCFIRRYLEGVTYKDCIYDKCANNFLKKVKQGRVPFLSVKKSIDYAYEKIEELFNYYSEREVDINHGVDLFLDNLVIKTCRSFYKNKFDNV